MNLDGIKRGLEMAMREAMLELAEETAQRIKDYHAWSTDSASLEESVTGYEPVIGDYDQHFNESNWRAARRRGYLSPRHANESVNFQVFAENRDMDEATRPTAIVTDFVHYGYEVETMPDVGGSFEDAFQYMQMWAVPYLQRHLSDFFKSF